MKKLIIVFLAIMFFVPLAMAESFDREEPEEKPAEESICPFTKISNNDKCTTCHQVERVSDGYEWAVREEKWRNAPYGVSFVKIDGEDAAYFVMDGVEPVKTFNVYEYCEKYGIKNVVIELHSPGGSVVDAWRVIGIIESHPDIKTTTKCMGMAASAGFVMLVSGDHRIASPRAMLMAHELMSFSFLKIERPSESKDEAEIMKLWQDNINQHLAEHSNMTADEIATKMKYKDWWMTGAEAIEYGFVDELIWGGELKTIP